MKRYNDLSMQDKSSLHSALHFTLCIHSNKLRDALLSVNPVVDYHSNHYALTLQGFKQLAFHLYNSIPKV